MYKKNYKAPDIKGHFGDYGGRFVPETLMPALIELEKAYKVNKKDRNFVEELGDLQQNFIGRPTPLYYAKDLTSHSLPEIGEAFGGRDHTTVIHANRKIRELKESDARIAEDFTNLLRILSN